MIDVSHYCTVVCVNQDISAHELTGKVMQSDAIYCKSPASPLIAQVACGHSFCPLFPSRTTAETQSAVHTQPFYPPDKSRDVNSCVTPTLTMLPAPMPACPTSLLGGVHEPSASLNSKCLICIKPSCTTVCSTAMWSSIVMIIPVVTFSCA